MTDISGSYASYLGESESERINRIVDQILAGERDFDSVRRPLYGTRFQPTTGGAATNDAAILASGDRAAVEARVRAIFQNSGQPIATVAPTGARDAFASLEQTFNTLGIPELADWAWQQIVEGKTQSEILLEMYEQPAFQARFPAIPAAREAGQPALTPGQVIEYEAGVRQIARAANLPEGLFSRPEDFVPLIANGLALPEIQTRVQEGFQRVARAAPEVRQWVQENMGVGGDAALAAIYLDPQRSLVELEKMTRTAEIGGTGRVFGLNVGLERAGRLADIGVTGDQMAQAGRQLSEVASAFTETISESENLTAEREGLGAVFEGDQSVRRRIGARAAATRGGGGSVTNERGLVGLGSAD